MKAEEAALAACTEDDVPDIIVNDKRTRAGLELEMRGLRDELDEKITRHEFQSCRDIQASIVELESKRESLPSLSNYRIASPLSWPASIRLLPLKILRRLNRKKKKWRS